jgi:hypothetical protein
VRDRGLEVGHGGALELEVAGQRLLGVLADHQLAEQLQVGQAFEEQDALDQRSACFISSIDSLYSCSSSAL